MQNAWHQLTCDFWGGDVCYIYAKRSVFTAREIVAPSAASALLLLLGLRLIQSSVMKGNKSTVGPPETLMNIHDDVCIILQCVNYSNFLSLIVFMSMIYHLFPSLLTCSLLIFSTLMYGWLMTLRYCIWNASN